MGKKSLDWSGLMHAWRLWLGRNAGGGEDEKVLVGLGWTHTHAMPCLAMLCLLCWVEYEGSGKGCDFLM